MTIASATSAPRRAGRTCCDRSRRASAGSCGTASARRTGRRAPGTATRRTGRRRRRRVRPSGTSPGMPSTVSDPNQVANTVAVTTYIGSDTPGVRVAARVLDEATRVQADADRDHPIDDDEPEEIAHERSTGRCDPVAGAGTRTIREKARALRGFSARRRRARNRRCAIERDRGRVLDRMQVDPCEARREHVGPRVGAEFGLHDEVVRHRRGVAVIAAREPGPVAREAADDGSAP